MTERERWIVYPLLFLALGAALRDKLSEHTKTKSIECQELTVYGEDGPNQPPVVLVQIGSVKRTSADSPHLGHIIVDGLVQAKEVQAEGIQGTNINADNYFFHQLPFGPMLFREFMRVLQLQATGPANAGKKSDVAPPPDDKPSESAQPQPATEESPPGE